MIIESVRAPNLEKLEKTEKFPMANEIVSHLLRVNEGVYDHTATQLLSFASTWAYSPLRTFADVIARRGLPGCECVSISISNDALFVDTAAYLVQSEDGKALILCFRGTEPRNAIDWLTDATSRKEPFFSAGYVHGGFYRAMKALWNPIKFLLFHAENGESICAAADKLRKLLPEICGSLETSVEPPSVSPPGHAKKNEVEALYITGHSLGGALAVLAAAHIYSDIKDPWIGLERELRGIYTFGQPMVGDAVFVSEYMRELPVFRTPVQPMGKKLFRHVYKNDIVPRMPPVTMGCFAHFGRQYNSTEAGWVHQPQPVRRLYTVGLSNILGVIAYVARDVFPIGWLRLPVSWSDHSPLNYMRTSLVVPRGSEFE